MPDQTTHASSMLRFGPFRLDLVGGQLLRGTEPIHLRPKAWDVLQVLASRPGSLVTHQELLDTVWPDAAVVPQVLTNAVRELRQALGNGTHGAYVETIARRGFRFVPGSAADTPPPGEGFIGRQHQLAWLTERWHHACDGRRVTTLVAGAPGIGKTTLVETFATRVASGSGNVLWGRCLEQHAGAEPFFPLLTAFGAAMRSGLADALGAALQQYGRRWLPLIPGAPASDHAHAGLSTPGQMLREGAAVLDASASTQPLLLVLDDLQWVDGSSLDLLALLAERSEPARLHVIGTYRPAEALAYGSGVRALAKRLRQRQQAELILESFSADEVRNYLEHRFDAATASALEGVAAEHSGGVPLYLRLAADHYEAHGRVTRTARGWTVAPTTDTSVALPDDIGDLVVDQFEALTPPQQALVRVAALCGDAFRADLLAPVLQWTGDRAERVCRALADDGRLLVRDDETGSFRFRHDVHRRVIETRLHDDPRRLHRTIAEVLEASQHDARAPEATRIAHHFRAAGEPVRAAAQLERAALGSLAVAGYGEAVVSLGAAVAELATALDDRTRAETECRLQQTLGTVLLFVEGYGSPRALHAVERASELARQLDLPEEAFRASNATTLGLLNSGRVSEAVASADHTAAIAETRLPKRQAFADVHCGYARATAGEFATARLHLESALRSDQSLQGLFMNAEPIARVVLGITLAAQGHLRAARDARERAVVLADAHGDPISQALVLFFASVAAAVERDAEATLGYAERVATISEEIGLRSARAGSTVMSEWALGQRAEAPRDPEAMRLACNERRQVNDRWGETAALGILAARQIRAGALDAAQASVDAGLAHVRSSGEGFGHVDLLCAQAEILRATSRADEAEQQLRDAVALANRQDAALLRLRAATGLGAVVAEAARHDEAEAVLTSAIAGLPERTASPDLAKAERLLATLRRTSP